MRRYPCSWDRLIAALGFRRRVTRAKRNNCVRSWRRPEALEQRELLASDTYVVSTVSDAASFGGPAEWSLREALLHSVSDNDGDDVIVFAPSLAGKTILLGDTNGDGAIGGGESATQLQISSNIIIDGAGAPGLSISGNDQSRVFLVETGGDYEVTLQNLTIERGYVWGASTARGAGVSSDGNTLTLSEVKIAGNVAGSHGGGVYSINGDVTVINSTFEGNTGYSGGGLMAYTASGASTAANAVRIEGSTFAGNTAAGHGGGLQLTQFNTVERGTVEIVNSTFSGNEAPRAGGIQIYGDPIDVTIDAATITDNTNTDLAGTVGALDKRLSGSTLVLTNTILAGNHTNAGSTPDLYIFGSQTSPAFSASHTLLGYNNSHFNPEVGIGNIELPMGIEIGLAPLGLYGGRTPTHALLPSSPAIDKGVNSASGPYDQRGVTRPADGNGDLTFVADIGAFEYVAGPIVVNTTSDVAVGSGELSLRQAIELANATPGADVIEFDPEVFATPQTITLADHDGVSGADPLTITSNNLMITGPGADMLTIDGSGATAVFSNAWLTEISGVTVRGANVGIQSSGYLTLKGVQAIDNLYVGVEANGGLLYLDNSIIAENGSGVTVFDDAYVWITNSTVSKNTGIGVCNVEGNVTLQHSTVAENQGLGVWGGYNGSVELYNSLIVNNQLAQTNPSARIDFDPGYVTAVGGIGNIISSQYSDSFTNDVNENVVLSDSAYDLSDVKLMTLGDYGGPTRTHALGAGSIAIDKTGFASSEVIDQRGFARLDTADIGAFEYQGDGAIVVTTASDVGVGPGELSLRQAIAMANATPGADVIEFDPEVFATPQTITLADHDGVSGADPLTITSNNLMITGPGADLLTIDGSGANGILLIPYGSATVTGVRLTGSASYSIEVGAGAYVNIDAIESSGNVAGVHSTGTTFVSNSAIVDNETYGLFFEGYGDVANSTISGNGWTGLTSHLGYVSVASTTIVGNSVGIDTNYNGELTLLNSLLVGNGDPDSPADLYVGSYGQLVSATNNLIGSAVDDSSTAPDITSQVGFSTKEFRIADLAFNGGPTRTHALLPGSIAIDAGSIAYDYSDATDQRGVGFPRVLGEAIDIGALEADAPIVVTTLSDEPSIGQLTLREAIAQASANQVITFAPWLNGGVLSLSAQSDLVIEKTLTIDASSLDQGLTIQAYDPDRLELGYQLFNANGGRVFYVKGRDVDLTLRGLTLSGGDTWSDGGAIYSLGASLTLDHVEVSHNASPRAPGYEIIGNTGFVDYPRDDPMNFAPIFGEYQTAARGGGVFSTGDLTIIDSLFVNNAIFNVGVRPDGDQIRGFREDTGSLVGVHSFLDLGEIFAGDIYTMGNLIIEGSRFETTPIDKDDITSGLAIGVPTNDNNLGLGGIYSTNERRGLPITVTINDVEFDTSRGIAVDTLYFADQTKFPSSIRRGDVARYEISEVRGGFLYLPDPNNQIAPEERPHLLSVLPGEYESIRFKHDGSATVPSFKIRVVFDGDLATEWLPISGTLNQEGAHSGSGGLDIDVGGEFDLDAVSSLLDGLNKKNTVVINNVTMVDSIGLMVVEPREKPEGLKELAAGGDGFIRYPAGSFVFLNANVSAQNLTVHHASTAGAAVAVLWSDVVIDDSRFLPPEGLDVGSGSTAVLAKASQLTITDSVFQGLRGPVIDVDLWGKLELIQSTIFNIQGDNAIRAAASFTETPAFPFAFPGSILIRDSVIRGVDRGSALAVFAPTSVTPEPEEPGENYDELPPEQDKLVHFSVREVLPFQVTIDGSTISNNRTYYGAGDAQTSGFGGAGLNLRGPLDVYITNSTISDNRQIGDSRDGGPVTDLSLLADPDNGLFNDLQYDGGFGGGIAAESMHRLRIENSTISGNQAGIAGGGIFISNTEHLELINATVTDNEAGYQGGGVFVVGGILGDIDDRYYIPTNDNAATFVNTIIAGNIAWNLGLFHDDPDPWVKTADEIDPNYGDGNGYFAIHSENTHDVWFASANALYKPTSFHSLSTLSRNNIIGVGVDPDLTTGGADPLLPIQDQQGAGLNGNVVGLWDARVDPQLTPLGDYGGPSEMHAIRKPASPAYDAGFWNSPEGKPDDELIRPVTASSSTFRYDRSPAFNLITESPTLRDTDSIVYPIINSSGSLPTDYSGAKWVSPDADSDRPNVSPVLTFGFNEVRELDRVVLWSVTTGAANSTLPLTIQISHSNDGGDSWTYLQVELVDWTNNGAGYGAGITLLLADGNYIEADTVRVSFPSLQRDQQVALGEVRFGGKRLTDQRGHRQNDPQSSPFDRKVGQIDVGAFELPTAYVSLPSLPDAGMLANLGVTSADITGYDLVVTSTDDNVVDLDLSPGNLSLREAILLANLLDSKQKIAVPSSLGDGVLFLKRGELQITDDVDLAAIGAGRLTIDASKSYVPLPEIANPPGADLPGPVNTFAQPNSSHSLTLSGTRNVLGSRLFNIDDETDDLLMVELSNLVLTGGFVHGSGGAIRSTENLTIYNSEIVGNSAHNLYVRPENTSVGSPIYPVDGWISLNLTFPETLGPSGGGLFVQGGSLVLDSSTVANNSANISGGGIHIEDGSLEVVSSVITDNVTRRMLSLDFWAMLVINRPATDGSINSPSIDPRGGGISIINSDAAIEDSVVTRNIALAADEPYIYSGGHSIDPYRVYGLFGLIGASGGGVYIEGSSVSIDDSEISRNEAFSGAGVYLRGAKELNDHAAAASLTATNTTISSNDAKVRTSPLRTIGNGDFASPKGAGIAASGNATLTLQHSTVVENQVHRGDWVSGTGTDVGAGIYFPDGGPSSAENYYGKLTIDHSIVASNSSYDSFSPSNDATDTLTGKPDGNTSTGSSDIYFGYSLPNSPDPYDSTIDPLIREMLRIDNSLIGNNDSLYSSWYSDYGPASPENAFGYVQSRYVNPDGSGQSLPWDQGGVPEADQWHNFIGGYAIGAGYYYAGGPLVESTPYYFAGVIDPGLDLLARNGGASATHAPLRSGTSRLAVIPVPGGGISYTGRASDTGEDAEQITADPIVGFNESSIGTGAPANAMSMTLPYVGNEAILKQRIVNTSWRTISSGPDADYFEDAPDNAKPTFEFDLGGSVELSEIVIWSALEFPDPSNGGSFTFRNGDEARVFKIDFKLNGNPVGSTLTRTRETTPTLAGLSETFVLDTPVLADQVIITITDNFYNQPGATGGGDRVALGQIRFVGELSDDFAVNDKSIAIDAGRTTLGASLTTDQRGSGYDRLFGDAIDIGAHETGALIDSLSPPLVEATNVVSSIVEGPQPDGMKVADLRLTNLANSPWSAVIGGANSDLFFIPTDAQGRLTRELWIKPGAVVDFESLYSDVNGEATLEVSVTVTDPSRGMLGESVPFVLPPIEVVNVNDLPTLDRPAPPISLASDVTPATNPGIAVSSLLARASDEDVGPMNEIGMAVVQVNLGSTPNSSLEYSLNNGITWRSVPYLASGKAFLLPDAALVRFNKQDDFTGSIDDVVLFRVWDQTAGKAGKVVNVEDIVGSLSLVDDSLAIGEDPSVGTGAIDVVVTPQVGPLQTLTAAARDSGSPAVAVDARGVGFHVWQEASGLRGKRVAGDGSLIAGVVDVANDATASNPRVVAGEGGGFLVVWEQTSGPNTGLYARRYNLVGEQLVAAGNAVALTDAQSVSSDGLGSLSFIASDDSFIVTWVSSGSAYLGLYALSSSGVLTQTLAPSPAPVSLAGGIQSGTVSTISSDGLTIHLAWLEESATEGHLYAVDYDVTLHAWGNVTSLITTPSVPPDGDTLDGWMVSDIQIAIGPDGEPLVGWRNTAEWSYLSAVDGVTDGISDHVRISRRVNGVWTSGVEDIDTADVINTSGVLTGERISGFSLAADRYGRLGLAWVKQVSGADASSLLTTRWIEEDGSTENTFAQAVSGSWSDPELSASASGKFDLTASTGAKVVAQRYRLSPLDAAEWSIDNERFEVRNGSNQTPRIELSVASYGGVAYFVVNDDLTTAKVSDVHKIVIVTGSTNDTVDLRGLVGAGLNSDVVYDVSTGAGDDSIFVGAGSLTINGGLGADKYYLSDQHDVNLVLADPGGLDQLLLTDWVGGPATIVLGYDGKQTITSAGSAHAVTLDLVKSDELDDVLSTNGAYVYKPSDKASQLTEGKLVVGVGGLTLEEALLWAKTDSKADVIAFADNLTSLSPTAQYTIDTAVTIDGEVSSGKLTIDGNSSTRLFFVVEGVNATLKNLILEDGQADSGGAIYSAGNLTLSGVEITGSTATTGDGGGVAFVGEQLTIRDSIIQGNAATNRHGGGVSFAGIEATIVRSAVNQNEAQQGAGLAVYSGEVSINRSAFIRNGVASTVSEGGGLWQEGESVVEVFNSTFSDNRANEGGAIFTSDPTAGANLLTLVNATLAHNRAVSGAAIYTDGQVVTAVKTLFAGNTNSAGTALTTISVNGAGVGEAFTDDSTRNLIENDATSAGGLLYTSFSTISFAANTDVTDVSQVLSALAPANEAIQYHPLVSGSPAIVQTDADPPSGPLSEEHKLYVDQRGYVPQAPDPLRDIGAYEFEGEADTGPSTFLSSDVVLKEDVRTGQLVARVQVDPAWRDFTFSIEGGNLNGVFSIDALTGEIRVEDASKLDAERTPIYALQVYADGPDAQDAEGYIRIVVESVNEAPTFAGPLTFDLPTTAITGDVVGVVTAYDQDASDKLEYEIIGAAAVTNAIEIDGDTGLIKVKSGANLRGLDALEFKVRATDLGELFKEVDVRVNLFKIAALDPKLAAEAGLEPIVVTNTPTEAAFTHTVSHASTVVFNPVATFENSPGKAFRVEILQAGGSSALSFNYSETGKLLTTGNPSRTFSLGKLTLRNDGALVYQPKSDLLTRNALKSEGGGGSYYYSNEALSYRIVDTDSGEVLLTDQPLTIQVTNSLPVFRSDYIGNPSGVLELTETIDVERFRNYVIDLDDLLYDPDGDPIKIEQFKSVNPLRLPDSKSGEPFQGDDPASGEQGISATFGYRLNSGGFASGVRQVTLDRTDVSATSSSSIVISHDGDSGDNDTDDFNNFGFAKRFSFIVSATDGQVSNNNSALVKQIRLTVQPWNSSQLLVGGPTEAAWLSSIQRHALSGTVDHDDLLDTDKWSFAAADIDSYRQGVDREFVGDTLVNLIDGSIIRRHDLVLDGSGGAAEATLPGLIYDSAVANPRPTVEAALSAPAGARINALTATFTWYDHVNTDATPNEVVTTVTYTGPALAKIRDGLVAGQPYHFAFQPSDAPIYSGVYRWKVAFEVDVDNRDISGDEKLTFTQSGETAVVVQKKVTAAGFGDDSPTKWNYTPQFGDGWALEGVPQLFVDDIRTGSDTTKDDRVILWFPGEQPMVFGLGDIGEGYSRQDYFNDPANGAFNKFVPFNPRTGLEDPREFGTLKINKLPGNSIVYTSPDAVSYAFEMQTVDSHPAWRLSEIRVPQADRPIGFEYSTSDPLRVSSITGTDGYIATIVAPQGNLVQVELAGNGDARVDLTIDVNNQLDNILHKNDVTSGDRKRDFTYVSNAVSLLATDKWGGGTIERSTSFQFDAAPFPDGLTIAAGQLTRITHGSSIYDVRPVFHGDVVRDGNWDAQDGAYKVAISENTDPRIADADGTATVKLDNTEGSDWYTRYTYDDAGNHVATESYFGTGYVANSLISSEAWTYDYLGSVKSYTDAIGRVSYFAYDYQNAVVSAPNPTNDTSGLYDEDDYGGNVVRLDSFSGTTRYAYSTDDNKFGAMGELVQAVDPNGLKSTREWDKYGQLVKLTVGDEHEEMWTYFHGDSTRANDGFYNVGFSGLLAKHVDSRGLITEYDYYSSDRRHKSTKVTDTGVANLADSGRTTKTTYFYDDNGFVATKTMEVDNAILSYAVYDYDRTGLLKSMVVHDKSGGAVLSEASYTYYDDGLIETETLGEATNRSKTKYTYDLRGLLTKVEQFANRATDTNPVTTNFTYYKDGRLKQTTLPDGETITVTDAILQRSELPLIGSSLTSNNYLQRSTSTTGVAGLTTYDANGAGGGAFGFGELTETVQQLIDNAGRLISEENLLSGAFTTYAYSDFRHDAPTEVIEELHLNNENVPKQIKSSFVYDIQGKVILERNPGSAPQAYRYSKLGYLVETNVLSLDGARFVYANNDAGDVLTETEYRKQPGGAAKTYVTEYGYDQSGRLRKVTDHADDNGGARVSTVTSTNDSSTVTIGTNPVVTRKVATTSPEGVKTYQYFDGAGRLLREQNAYGGVTGYEYDKSGNLIKATEVAPTGGADRITAYAYDGLNRVVKVTQHGAGIDIDPDDGEGELIMTTHYFDGSGNNYDVVVTDPLGVKTSTRYDSLGNVVVVRVGDETVGDASTNDDLLVISSYASSGGFVVVTRRTTSRRAEYEGFTSGTREHDETTVSRSLLNTRGDVLKSAVRVSGLEESDNIPLGSFPGAAVLSPGYAIRQTNKYRADGLLSESIDGTGKSTAYTYNTSIGVPLVETVKRGEQVTKYAYDSVGNRLSMSVDGKNEITWEYDQAGRVTKETAYLDPTTPEGDPVPVTRTWTYDKLKTTSKDRNGVVFAAEFTPAGPQGPAVDKQWTVSAPADYDDYKPYTAYVRYNADGSLQEAVDAWTASWDGSNTSLTSSIDQSAVEYTYDQYGRFASETSKHTFNGLQAPTTSVDGIAYHSNGAREQADWKLNGTLVAHNEYGLDARGRVSAVTQSAGSGGPWAGGVAADAKAAAFAYNADDRRHRIDRYATADTAGASIGHTDYSYLDEGTLETLAHYRAEGAASTIASHLFSYDNAGRIDGAGMAVHDDMGALLSTTRPTVFYNPRGEVIGVGGDSHSAIDEVTQSAMADYGRDAFGNTTAAGEEYGRLNRLKTDGATDYAYDAEGRLTVIDVEGTAYNQYLTWDHRGLLQRWADAQLNSEGEEILTRHEVEYFYDVLGRKVARRDTEVNFTPDHTIYAYDGDRLAFEIDAFTGKVTRSYFHGPGVNEVLAIDQTAGGNIETVWQFANHVGSVTSVGVYDYTPDPNDSNWHLRHRNVDAAGRLGVDFAGTQDSVLLGRESSPFAQFLEASPALFAGHQLDESTGLYDMRARWYDPAHQRFLSEDPLGDSGGSTNLYQYAGGDPVNYVDPDGRVIFTAAALTAAGVYVAWQAGFAAGETAIEYGATSAFSTQQDVANFSTLGTFGKNFAINLATGGIGGKVKTASIVARLGRQAALYAGRQGIEIAGDTAYDVGYHGRGFGESLAINAIGSVAGEAAGRAIGAGARAFHRNFEVSLDPSGVYLGSSLGGAGGLSVRPRMFRSISGQGQLVFESINNRVSVPRIPVSSDLLATPNRLQNKLSAWRRYEGDLSLAQWSKKYDQLQVNRARSAWAESFGSPGARYSTPYGARNVDNAPAIEIKTGYQSATKFVRSQIIKDSFLRRTIDGYNPVWRFIDQMPSRPLLNKLDTFGIPYELPVR